ncbi:hypothetical protein MHLP_02105 [Candidatus Mycoplasma haematolamae str. Purdue]|uniref:Uncharacterized protein n=1 Tax=Mycoplasma haematolamae (strain Purdue) TaxID=1212765 RepID=I7CFL5_MYCHA|nr:hypothetical protein [Candidatus Mycoplasma haematolamae]AFO52001.1 hypothetical protein MHLP_02105 [Candidatus Mycoplasma haematolamae str. Purdue]
MIGAGGVVGGGCGIAEVVRISRSSKISTTKENREDSQRDLKVDSHSTGELLNQEKELETSRSSSPLGSPERLGSDSDHHVSSESSLDDEEIEEEDEKTQLTGRLVLTNSSSDESYGNSYVFELYFGNEQAERQGVTSFSFSVKGSESELKKSVRKFNDDVWFDSLTLKEFLKEFDSKKSILKKVFPGNTLSSWQKSIEQLAN